MQKKAIIGTLILVIAFAFSFIAFQPNGGAERRPAGAKEPSSPRKEKDSKLIWENLSHQFFPLATSTGSGFTPEM